MAHIFPSRVTPWSLLMRVRMPRSTGSGTLSRFGFGAVPGGSAWILYSLPPLLKKRVLVSSGNQFGASSRPGWVSTYATRRSADCTLIVSSVLTRVIRAAAGAGGGGLSATAEDAPVPIRPASCDGTPAPAYKSPVEA